MMSSPRAPIPRLSINSETELQSRPKPMLFMIARILGLGRALTAKYSRKESSPAKAACSRAPVSLMPVSS